MIYHTFAGQHFNETPYFWGPWFFFGGRLGSPKKLQSEATLRLRAVGFHRRKQGPSGDGTGIRAPHLLEAKAPTTARWGVVVGDGWVHIHTPNQIYISSMRVKHI